MSTDKSKTNDEAKKQEAKPSNEQEKLNPNQVNEILEIDEVKEKVNEEIKAKANRLIMEDKFQSRYTPEQLEQSLGTFKRLDGDGFQKIISKREEILADPKKYSINDLEEAEKSINAAYEVQHLIEKSKSANLHSESRPVIDNASSYNNSAHQDYPEHKKINLRDLEYTASKDATLGWTDELNRIMRSQPRLVKSMETSLH